MLWAEHRKETLKYWICLENNQLKKEMFLRPGVQETLFTLLITPVIILCVLEVDVTNRKCIYLQVIGPFISCQNRMTLIWQYSKKTCKYLI